MTKLRQGIVIKHDNGTYFREWTGIGPRFGASKEEAQVFPSRWAASREMARHGAFAMCTLEPQVTEWKALSLSRPWPWAFLSASSPKRIENRRRKDGRMPAICRYRGPLLLHAAKSWDKEAAAWMVGRGLLTDDQRRGPFLAYGPDAAHLVSVVFARCRVVAHVAPDDGVNVMLRPGDRGPGLPLDHTTAERSQHQSLQASLDFRWWMGGYALVLADVEPTPLVPCKGALGIWRVPESVAAQLGAVRP